MLDMIAAIPVVGPVVSYVVPFIFVLSVIIFVHELGHYVIGRWCGIGVEVFSVGHQQEREVALQLSSNLLSEETHGVGLAAALGVPEHAKPAEARMSPLDDVYRSFRNEGRHGLCPVRPRLGPGRPSRFKRQRDNAAP